MMAIFGVCFPYIHHIEGEIGQGRYSLLCHGPWLCWHFGSLGWTTCSPRSTVVWTKTRFNEDRTNESAHSSRSWVLLYIRLQKTATLLFVWSINPKTCTSLRKEKTRSLKVTKSLNKPYIKSIWNFSKMIYIYIYPPQPINLPCFCFRFCSTSSGSAKKNNCSQLSGLVRWDPIPESGTQSYQTSPENRYPVTCRGGRQPGDPWSCWRGKNVTCLGQT